MNRRSQLCGVSSRFSTFPEIQALILVGYLCISMGASAASSYTNVPQSDPSKDTVHHITESLTIRKLLPEIYLVTHSFPWPANSLFIRANSDSCFLIDTPWENGGTQELMAWIDSVFESPHLIVLNTHFHRDNLGGNGFLLSRNIPIYGSSLTVRLLENSLSNIQSNTAAWLDSTAFKHHFDIFTKTELRPPDHCFDISKGILFRYTDMTIEVFYPGPAHTVDNIIVYLPEHHVLFGGCMVKSLSSRTLGFTGDADLESWPSSLENLLRTYPDAKLVVPGHGRPGGLDLIRHTLDLLRDSGYIHVRHGNTDNG